MLNLKNITTSHPSETIAMTGKKKNKITHNDKLVIWMIKVNKTNQRG